MKSLNRIVSLRHKYGMSVTVIKAPSAFVIKTASQYFTAIIVFRIRIYKARTDIIPIRPSYDIRCTSYCLLLKHTSFVIFFPVKIEVVKLNQIPESKAVPYLYRKVCHIMSCIHACKSLNGHNSPLRLSKCSYHRSRMVILSSGNVNHIRINPAYYLS